MKCVTSNISTFGNHHDINHEETVQLRILSEIIEEVGMLWFVLILAISIAVLVGLITRNLKKALLFGAASFIIGVLFSFLIVFSGIMGG